MLGPADYASGGHVSATVAELSCVCVVSEYVSVSTRCGPLDAGEAAAAAGGDGAAAGAAAAAASVSVGGQTYKVLSMLPGELLEQFGQQPADNQGRVCVGWDVFLVWDFGGHRE